MMEVKKQLTESSGENFFCALETFMKIKTPDTIKKILKSNSYDNAFTFSKFDDASIDEINDCMRNIFDKNLISDGETMEQYLGKFIKNQKKFILVSGELSILKSIAQTCQNLYVVQPVADSSHHLDPPHIALDEEQISADTSEPGATRNTLFNIIGSHMIHIYNDAKRTTLSAWSWPSRHVAAELANNYKLGHRSAPDIDRQYVTPGSHAEFLDCIVLSDIEHLKDHIRESLAVSLRVDGSVDRTQKHNVFVMVHIVKKDATIGTLCIGFDIQKTGGVSGYLDCLKNVTNKVLPWEEFFPFVTSVVTDGEYLNLGRLNGLVAKLIESRNLDPSNSPLFSIWCVPHRTNLAWKAVTATNIIASLIKSATKLSSYFHNSAKCTQKLHKAASDNGLFFAVRWIEFVFNLFHVLLRNWRASITYFESEQLTAQSKQWRQYDTLHLLTFPTDVLSLLKIFQKSCQLDTITLPDISPLKVSLIEKLEHCKVTHIHGGWEQLFLQKTVTNGNFVSLCGIELIKTSTTRTRRMAGSFSGNKREHILQKLIQDLNLRLSLDNSLLLAFEPLVNISLLTPQDQIKLCHQTTATDLDENRFISEYYIAAQLLNGIQYSSTLASLQKLNAIGPNEIHSIKVALARITAAKPHSADVERLISIYNKFKNPDRSTLSQKTLSNYLCINTNMPPLEDYDPTSAVQLRTGKKQRQQKSHTRSNEQKWFNGVSHASTNINPKQISIQIQF